MPQTTSRRSATTPPISTSKHKAASPALDNDMDDADLTTAVVGSPPVGGVSPPVVENALAASDGDDGANEEELGVGRGIGQPMDGMESSEEDLGALGSGFGGSNERTIPARGSDVGTSVTTGTLGTGSGSTEGPITRRRQSLETATIDKVVPSVTKVAQANLAEIAMETPDDILLIGSSSAAAPINVEASNSQPSGGSDSDTSPIALDPEAARARSEARGKGRAFSQSPPTNTPAWDPTYTRETASTDERPGLSRGGSSSSLTGMSEDVDGTYAQLLAMGFEPKVCEIALRKCIKQRKQNEEKRIQESEAQGQTGGSSPKVGKKPEIPPPVPPLLDVVVAYIVERTGDGDGIRGVELGASSPSAGRRQSSEPEVLHEPGAVRAPTKSILKNSNPSLASNPAASAANQMNFGSLGGVTSGFFSNFAQNMAALDHRHAATNTANAKEGSAGNSNPAGGSLFPRGLTQMGKQALTSFQGKVKPLLKQISSDLTDSSDDEPHNGTKDTRPTPAPPIQKSAFVIGGSSDSLQSNASRQTDETPLFTRRPLSSASNSSAPPQSPSRATPQPSPQRPLSAHNPTQEKHVRFSFPDLRSHVLAAQASALADGEVSPAPSSPMSVSSQNSLPPMSPSAWEGWDSPLDDGANPQHQLWSPATRMSESSDYFQNEYSNTTVGAGAASASPIVRPAPSASHVTTPDALLTFYQTRCLLRNEVMVESIASQIRKSVLPNETASLTAVTFEGQHGGDNEDGDGTRLSSLSFDGIVVGPRNVASLSDLLSTKYPLRKLSLSHVTLDDETLKPLLSALLAHDTVRELSLAHAKKVRGPSLKHLAVYVKKATSLRTLDVTGLPFDQRSVSFLAHALKEGAALETMRMDQCDMSPSLLSIFASGIADSRLTSLSLRGNAKLFRDSGSALSLLLGPGSSSGANGVPLSVITTSTYIVRGLRVLDLGDNAIGRSFTAFPRALKHNQRLEELYLSNSRALDSDSIAELADALKTNNALRVLDLSGASLDKNNQLEAMR
ncbi:uncharacterized protein EV422DRAFT_99053 [Fimicolochytrium jonesii]|uniref:uncharacterized protein n=1 Tax=Fimicolochytrium jonesii TaxID=1396493 RepID=UPI0022FF04C7|nr:uncharacterized protein EV422DRAFT_99053 [Fimicolochytrium jonesii]KAI8819613.1 hypothetical protein EV422DRAFT_99053 [Fimicolochytrium jonesii]